MNRFFRITLILLICTVTLFPSSYMHAAYASIFTDVVQDEVILPVIMYHSTDAKNPNAYNIKPSQLENDIIYLKNCGYTTITVADLIKYTNGGELPEKPIMLTFDDGYYNNYSNAFSIFKKHNVACVMSVVGKLVDDNYDKNGELNLNRSHLNYEQIKEMSDSGLVEFQNHTYNLHNTKNRRGMKKCYGETCENYESLIVEDLTKLQIRLFDKVNITCTAVAFPFGFFDKETIDIVKDLGFKAAFTCREKTNRITRTDFYLLNRYNRPHGKTAESFFSPRGIK